MSFGGIMHHIASTPAILKSYKEGEFTDLTIRCGSLIFNVHAVVVCSTCDFFKKSLKFAVGKESEERVIDLPEDDPEMVRRLIAYLYLGDYDPTNSHFVARFEKIKQYDSTSPPNATYHCRRSGFGNTMNDACSCFAQNTLEIAQLRAETAANGLNDDGQAFQKLDSLIEVANPLTIHATMYALGDKYQVDGLSDLAKEKFDSCLKHHAHSEDFISAVQIAYSSTPDSNRGLRDSVLRAFRVHFKTDIKQIPGAEVKLDSIDELAFLLITNWPVKAGQANTTEKGRAEAPLAEDDDAHTATWTPPWAREGSYAHSVWASRGPTGAQALPSLNFGVAHQPATGSGQPSVGPFGQTRGFRPPPATQNPFGSGQLFGSTRSQNTQH